jgi:hypothetical protein
VNTLAAGWLALDVATGFTPSVDTRATAVTITRAAPPEWPPQPADVWSDCDGNTWVALGDLNGAVEMHMSTDITSRWSDSAEVLAVVAPMRLEFRPGWTRQPDPVPAGPAEPGEVDERTSVVLSLRSLANYIEANPDIPTPYAPGAQCNADSAEHFAALVDRHSATTLHDDEKSAHAKVHFGSATLTFYYRKPQPELRTPDEWGREFGVRVVDPDGWRGKDGRDWNDSISREEYERRMVLSTVEGLSDRRTAPDEEPTQPLQIVIADGGNGPAGLIGIGPVPVDDPAPIDNDADDRCTSTTPGEFAPGEHKCELYGTHPDGPHICLCGTQWPNADQPVPAQRDAAE